MGKLKSLPNSKSRGRFLYGRQEMGRNRTKQLELDCAAGTIEVNFNGQ
ncbi:MAG: hypothetical protein ACLT46_08195 [Hungatella sp.]